MALIKHRPSIRLLLAPEVRPGEEFGGTVVIDATREVPIAHLVVELTGTERGSIGSGNSTITRTREVCRLRATLSGEDTLDPGKSEYKCRFTIPAGAPPSYKGSRGRCEYLVSVRVSIPWWPDAKRTFEINVGMEDREPIHDGKALVFSSRPEGPRAREPHIECSLTSDVVAQGGVVAGAVALGNVAYNRYGGITLSIRGVETIHLSKRRSATNELRRYEASVAVEPLQEGTPYPFRIRLPDDPPPTFGSQLWSLSWEIEVRAKIRWGSDLRITVPFTVVPKRFRTAASTNRLAPPDVGSERLQRIWAEVAERTPLELDGSMLRGKVGDVMVEISRDHRGRKGIYLVAALSYPSLGLDLHIQPYARFEWGSPGVKLGDARFDLDHHVTCRERAQAASLVAPFAPHLAAFREVEVNDTSARLGAHGSGASKAKLVEFAAAALAVAGGIHVGRARIPPPASMADALLVWRALANDLGGELSVANMSVTGSVLGCAVTVQTLFGEGGAASGTVIALDLVHAVDEAHRVTALGDSTDSLDVLPDDAARVARRVVRGAYQLSIDANRIALTLRPAAVDGQRLAGRARSLGELAKSLLGAAGPYR